MGLGFSVGDKATVAVESGFFKGEYPSRVEDLEEASSRVVLSYPFWKGVPVPLFKETFVRVFVVSSGGVISFRGRVERLELAGTPPLLHLSIASELERVQRRRYVRVPVLLEVPFFNLSAEERSAGSSSWGRCVALDMSVGGARLRARSGLVSVDDRLVLHLVLEEQGEGKKGVLLDRLVLARVVRRAGGEGLEEEWGVSFLGVVGHLERQLQRFVFARELTSRQR